MVLAAVPAAYYTARHRFRGRRAPSSSWSWSPRCSRRPPSWWASTASSSSSGLVNTYAALILTNAAFNLAFAIWILRAFFASIPREIEEAAAVDGCGQLRHPRPRSSLPARRPGHRDRGHLRVHRRVERVHRRADAHDGCRHDGRSPSGITSYVTAYVQHWDLLFAASVIAIVPVVVLFALIEPYLVGGLTAGGVK